MTSLDGKCLQHFWLPPTRRPGGLTKEQAERCYYSFCILLVVWKITEIDFISGCIFLKRIIINLIIYYLIVSTFTCCQLKKISPSASSLSKSGCWFGFWFLTMINMLLRPNYYLITKCRTAPISECCAPSTRSLPWSKYYINIYISRYFIYIIYYIYITHPLE